jgi:hypothetical protein
MIGNLPLSAPSSLRPRVALIEVLEADGRVHHSVDVVAWPVTIGRALDNSIVLADPYTAAHHARIDGDEQGDVTLTVFSSLNGVRDVNAGSQHLAGEPRLRLPAGGTTLQVGNTKLRLRLPSEVLVPEQALPLWSQRPHRDAPALQRAWPWLLGAALLGLQCASHWIALDPGADHTAWLPTLIGLPLGVAAWAALWALLSKLFQQHFDFSGHLRIALPWLLVWTAVGMLWPQLGAALSQPWLWRLAEPLGLVLGALMLRAHLAHVLPHHTRAIGVGVVALAAVGMAVSLANTYRNFDAFSSTPYMATLPMPALRLARSAPSSELVQAMAPLATRLAKRVKKARDEEEVDSADAGVD